MIWIFSTSGRKLVTFLNLAGGARNQTLVNVMCDYACMEARVMGMRNTIIPGMRAHNGTAPELIAEDQRFIVRLLKAPKEKS